MTNKQIARHFTDLAAIMELHDENPFKIRSYTNAYITLKKLDTPLKDMKRSEIDAIKGVGKAIGDKIQELLQTGELQTYRQYADITPSGVIEMLSIKGFGPKKVLAVWKELEIETVGELLYACNENRLIELHGFGQKTQEEIRKNTEYYLRSRHKLHWATANALANDVEQHIHKHFQASNVSRVGDLRRCVPTIDVLAFLIAVDEPSNVEMLFDNQILMNMKTENNIFIGELESGFPIHIYTCAISEFGSKLFKYTGSRLFIENFVRHTEGVDFKHLATEEAVFQKANLPFIAPELREDTNFSDTKSTLSDSPNLFSDTKPTLSDSPNLFSDTKSTFSDSPNTFSDTKQVLPGSQNVLQRAISGNLPTLIKIGDIKGVIHTHTTYSDGLHTISDMANAAQRLGYGYIGITDHSKAAFYANGMKEDRVFEQWKEIDALNSTLFNFKILKGIECDILNDGTMDYSDDILKDFDFVIASIHSNLKMSEEKATSRLIKAIESPYVTILGHLTGRLLLSREGYPVNHVKIIEACAANKVAIELNANPYRLDLDWSWVSFARDCGVLISINPDAHSMSGISDIYYGVLAARKGFLDADGCINTRDVSDFLKK